MHIFRFWVDFALKRVRDLIRFLSVKLINRAGGSFKPTLHGHSLAGGSLSSKTFSNVRPHV